MRLLWVLVVAVFCVACSVDAGATPTERVPVPSAVTVGPTASASPPPSPRHTFMFSGETPASDATVPPGWPAVPGLTPADFIAAVEPLNPSCESYRANIPEAGEIGWGISCNQVAAEEYNATLIYWTPEDAGWIHAGMLPSPFDAEVEDPDAAFRFFDGLARLPYDGADPEASSAWLSENIDNPECLEVPCTTEIGGVQFAVQLGLRGSRSFSMDPGPTTP